MDKMLRGNDDQGQGTSDAASAFARMALARVGGSSVYIEPKKTQGKRIDVDDIK